MQNKNKCEHVYSIDEKQYVTDFRCIMCGRIDVVSNNAAADFKRNNFIVSRNGSEA